MKGWQQEGGGLLRREIKTDRWLEKSFSIWLKKAFHLLYYLYHPDLCKQIRSDWEILRLLGQLVSVVVMVLLRRFYCLHSIFSIFFKHFFTEFQFCASKRSSDVQFLYFDRSWFFWVWFYQWCGNSHQNYRGLVMWPPLLFFWSEL